MTEDKAHNPNEEPLSIEEEPISLVDEAGGAAHAKMRAFGAGTGAVKRSAFKRPPNVDGHGATRCRVFNSKISIAALQLMEGQINEWLDGDSIEVKEVGHLVGTLQAKQPELNVIVFVWY